MVPPPALWGYRLGADHFPASGGNDGRPHLGREHAGPGKHISLFTAKLKVGKTARPSQDNCTERKGPPASTGEKRKLRVMLVEDNLVNQVLASRLLERQGHHVTVVGDGRKALNILIHEKFDLAIMDVQMPEMDGFEATAAIREAEQYTGGRLPIIAMTAHAMKGDRERCLSAGMDGYVSKPIHVQELLAVMDDVLKRADDFPSRQ